MHLANGKILRIVTHNLDSGHINHYIQSATLNDAPLNTAWFRHSQIKDGATLVLMMGSAPADWGITNPPPSESNSSAPDCTRAAGN